RSSPASPLFPYTTLFRSQIGQLVLEPGGVDLRPRGARDLGVNRRLDDLPGAPELLVQLLAGADARELDLDPPSGHLPREPDHLRSEEHTSELQSRGHLVC